MCHLSQYNEPGFDREPIAEKTPCQHCGKQIEESEQYIDSDSEMALCIACLAFYLICEINESEEHQAIYRDYVIYQDGGYQAYHKEYDGAPDANDNRFVHQWGGYTMMNLITAIDENIEELN